MAGIAAAHGIMVGGSLPGGHPDPRRHALTRETTSLAICMVPGTHPAGKPPEDALARLGRVLSEEHLEILTAASNVRLARDVQAARLTAEILPSGALLMPGEGNPKLIRPVARGVK
jgi:hypothetical protein